MKSIDIAIKVFTGRERFNKLFENFMVLIPISLNKTKWSTKEYGFNVYLFHITRERDYLILDFNILISFSRGIIKFLN